MRECRYQLTQIIHRFFQTWHVYILHTFEATDLIKLIHVVKKAICSRNIRTSWFQAIVKRNKSNFWSINKTMCTSYIASERYPSLTHLFTILCPIICFLIIILLQILLGKLETWVNKLYYKNILKSRLKE